MTYIKNLNNTNPIMSMWIPTPDAVAAEMLSRLSGACPEALLADLLAGESFECDGYGFVHADSPHAPTI